VFYRSAVEAICVPSKCLAVSTRCSSLLSSTHRTLPWPISFLDHSQSARLPLLAEGLVRSQFRIELLQFDFSLDRHSCRQSRLSLQPQPGSRRPHHLTLHKLQYSNLLACRLNNYTNPVASAEAYRPCRLVREPRHYPRHRALQHCGPISRPAITPLDLQKRIQTREARREQSRRPYGSIIF
jgi:hypothetical protein